VKRWKKSEKNQKEKLGTAKDAKTISHQFQDSNFTCAKRTHNTGAHYATKILKWSYREKMKILLMQNHMMTTEIVSWNIVQMLEINKKYYNQKSNGL
jgi:hypothetical protein